MSNKKKYLLISLLIVVVDQISKQLIKAHVGLFEKIDVIKGFFCITHTRNSGAVWGLFANKSGTIIPKIITIAAFLALLIILYLFFRKTSLDHKMELFSLSFIIGGAIGNISDRIFQGYVIDFLDFYIKDLHWPTFNVADSFITIGVLLLAISLWLGKSSLKTK